jgi:transposase
LIFDVANNSESGGQAMAKEVVNEAYRIPDETWKQIEPLLPPELPRSEDEHLQMDSRKAMEAILFRLRTDCNRESPPRDLELSSTVHSRFEEWRDAGVFQRMWKAGLLEYDELRTLFWHGRWHIKRR